MPSPSTPAYTDKIGAYARGAWSRVLSSPRCRVWARVALAGPGAIVASLLVVMGMSLWMPVGSAGIDQLIFPLILMPLVWGLLFFHACLDRSLARAAIVAAALCASNGGVVTWHMIGTHQAPSVSP